MERNLNNEKKIKNNILVFVYRRLTKTAAPALRLSGRKSIYFIYFINHRANICNKYFKKQALI